MPAKRGRHADAWMGEVTEINRKLPPATLIAKKAATCVPVFADLLLVCFRTIRFPETLSARFLSGPTALEPLLHIGNVHTCFRNPTTT